jgi:hypothetical protein
MRLRAPSLLVLPLALLIAVVGNVDAQQGDFAGSYTLDAAQSDDIARVVSSSLSKVKNPLLRPFARGRLTKTNAPYPGITISELEGGQLSIRYGQGNPVVVPTNGQRVDWTREDGERMQVSATLSGDRLVQTFHAEDGTRVNTFGFTPNGSLRVDVSVSSDRLSSPITYKLVYARS